MNISATQVKELREMTGVGMMECKKALIESSGDMEKAIVWLRERGMSRAAAKSARVAAEGLINVLVNPEQTKAVILEINCETDFVAKNDEFKEFVKQATDVAMKNGCTDVDCLSSKKLSDGMTVGDRLTQLIAKIGENMKVRRVQQLKTETGMVFGYIHFGSKLGTVVVLEGARGKEIEEIGKDLAMHVAAANPKYLNSNAVDKTELEQEKEIARKKLREQNKPENMIEKIVEGQMTKFYKEVCLVEQAFVKDPEINITAYLKKSGKPLSISSFARFQVGEGIEKKKDDCAV